MNRLHVAILFGGTSEEHAVSVKSAGEIAKSLDRARYEPYYIGITRDGEWKLCDGPVPGWEGGNARTVMLSPDSAAHGVLVLEGNRYRMIRVDVVFAVLHGSPGEDGVLQGVMELSGIPYVGCDVQSSVVCMDKSLAYLVARSVGVATPRFQAVDEGEIFDPDGLRYPVFVKPARSGSSFGVSKVFRKEELPDALTQARRYDAKVLIEEEVVGREVGCAILESDAGLIFGEPDRVALSGGFFRIHQESQPEKGSENATFVVPADITAAERKRVLDTARVLYRAMGCKGLARVDLFVTDEGRVVLNEINTMPGLTSYSRFPRMMAAAGLPLGDVIDRVISSALARRVG